MRAENLANLTRAVHGNCFDICGQRTDVPFMTVQEGLCFRNCVTKFSTWYPTLRGNLENSSFRYYQ